MTDNERDGAKETGTEPGGTTGTGPQDTQHLRDAILSLVNARSAQAQASQYDWKVAVAAIGAARDVVQSVPVDLEPRDYAGEVVERLRSLVLTYHDPDGDYTSGKGVIGDVCFDVQSFVDRERDGEPD
ncbi:MAG: hypothetical protein ACR2PM_08920 [Hyphomicrobiales bacterium]